MERPREDQDSTPVFRMMEELLRKVETQPRFRLGNIVKIGGEYARRSGTFFIIPPRSPAQPDYTLVHHDTVREGSGRVENLFGVWEIRPDSQGIVTQGHSTYRHTVPMSDPHDIISTALKSCTNKNVSAQPVWDLMVGIAMMGNQDRKTALAITELPGFNGSDADEIRA